MVLSKFACAARKGLSVAMAVLSRGLRCVDGVRKGLTSSSMVSLQAALLMLNVCVLTAGAPSQTPLPPERPTRPSLLLPCLWWRALPCTTP